MTCRELAEKIEAMQPNATPQDVARLCLLLTNSIGDLDELAIKRRLAEASAELGLRLLAATDQHAAMTTELEQLARLNPKEFTPDQIWILIRSIKVQSQVLQLYVGQTAIDV